jgi:hypothetical protein
MAEAISTMVWGCDPANSRTAGESSMAEAKTILKLTLAIQVLDAITDFEVLASGCSIGWGPA